LQCLSDQINALLYEIAQHRIDLNRVLLGVTLEAEKKRSDLKAKIDSKEAIVKRLQARMMQGEIILSCIQ
jgi:hypothetical protein